MQASHRIAVTALVLSSRTTGGQGWAIRSRANVLDRGKRVGIVLTGLLVGLLSTDLQAASYSVLVTDHQNNDTIGFAEDGQPVEFTAGYSRLRGALENGRTDGFGDAGRDVLVVRNTGRANNSLTRIGATVFLPLTTTAGLAIDDVVITGPEGSVPVSVGLAVSGTVDSQVNGFGANTVLATATANFGGVNTVWNFDGAVDTAVSTPVFNAQTGAAFDLAFTMRVRTSVAASNPGEPASATLDAAFALRLPEPLLSLPPGFTANSADGSIVDNKLVRPVADLVITADTPQAELDEVTRVDGSIIIIGQTGLDGVSLPNLVSVAGDFNVIGNPDLDTVDTPMLEEVGGDVDVRDNRDLDRLLMDNLLRIGRDLHIEDNNALLGLDFTLLGDVGEDLVIANNDGAESLDLPALTSTGCDFSVLNNGNTRRIRSTLATVGCALTIRDNGRATQIELDELLEITEGVTVTGNAAAAAHVPALVEVGGNLTITQTAESTNAIDLRVGEEGYETRIVTPGEEPEAIDVIVTNTGLQTLTNIVLSEDGPFGAGFVIGDLAPGEVYRNDFFPSSDLMLVVVGETPSGNEVRDHDGVFVRDERLPVVLDIEAPFSAALGDVLPVTVDLTNVGDVAVSDVVVESFFEACGGAVGNMAPGESTAVACSVVATDQNSEVAGFMDLEARVRGRKPGGPLLNGVGSLERVDIFRPSLRVAAIPDNLDQDSFGRFQAVPGTDVDLDLTIRNAGDDSLVDVELLSDVPGCAQPIGALGIDESVTVRCTLFDYSGQSTALLFTAVGLPFRLTQPVSAATLARFIAIDPLVDVRVGPEGPDVRTVPAGVDVLVSAEVDVREPLSRLDVLVVANDTIFCDIDLENVPAGTEAIACPIPGGPVDLDIRAVATGVTPSGLTGLDMDPSTVQVAAVQDFSAVSVEGDLTLTLTADGVDAQTPGGDAALTLSGGAATMHATLPDGALDQSVAFSIVDVSAAEAAAQDEDAPVAIEPLSAYRFDFEIETLNADATLAFEILVPALAPEAQVAVVDALIANHLTLAVRGDEPGATYQPFAVCAEGESPAVDDCASVTALAADGTTLTGTDLATVVPERVVFDAVTGSFSTWAPAIVTPRSPADVNRDGVLDAADYAAFIATFGLCEGDAGYLGRANLDASDRCITFVDYHLWYTAFVSQ